MNIISTLIKSLTTLSLITIINCAPEVYERDIRPIGLSPQHIKLLNESLKKWDSGDHVTEYTRNTIQFVSHEYLTSICNSDKCVAYTEAMLRWNDEVLSDEDRRISIYIDEKYATNHDEDLKRIMLHELGHFVMFNSCEDLNRGYDNSGHIKTIGHSLFPYLYGMTDYVTPEDRELVCLNSTLKDVERRENWR